MPSFLSLQVMATKLYNKGFNGWSQLGLFMGLWGVGLIAGSIAAIGVWAAMTGQGLMNMQQDMMKPQYANAVKLIQLVSTFFIFFIPAICYAAICYKNKWLALGFRRSFDWKLAAIGLLILVAGMPLIDALSLLNKVIPLPAPTRSYFDDLEKSYEEQVKVIADVKTVGQYLFSLIMIALLPAVFEETLFRGGLQNLFSRWKNNAFIYVFFTAVLLVAARSIWFKDLLNPWIFYGALLVICLLIYRSVSLLDGLNKVTNHFLFPVIFISILFSAIHGSWYGFLPRVALGMLLGLIFYFTNNLFYNILLHFINNAAVVTIMFIDARQNKPVETEGEEIFPWWTAFFAIAALLFLFRWLVHLPKDDAPEEVFLNTGNPFENMVETQNDPEE